IPNPIVPTEEPPMNPLSRHWRLALAAAAGLSIAAHAADPIKIGISIAQSPPGSVVQGTQVKDRLEIIKDHVNKAGGVLGRTIQLLYEDNHGVPDKGRPATEKLITRDKALAVTGSPPRSCV